MHTRLGNDRAECEVRGFKADYSKYRLESLIV